VAALVGIKHQDVNAVRIAGVVGFVEALHSQPRDGRAGVRLGVEVYATRLAAERVAAGADPTPLRRALDDCEEAISSGDNDEVSAANTGLHETIMTMCDNALLLGMLRSVAGRQRWIYRMTGGTDIRLGIEEHRRLCEAIIAGDPALAGSLAYAHIARTRQPTVDALQGRLPPHPAHSP
jgi:DNA-binding GntR family transcriptional regulator